VSSAPTTTTDQAINSALTTFEVLEDLDIVCADDDEEVGRASIGSASPRRADSVSHRSRKKRKTISWVHDYFSLDREPGELVCVKCVADLPKKNPASFSLNSSTSTLSRHLNVSHKLCSTGTIAIDPDQSTLRIDGTLDLNNQINDQRKSEILTALCTFIVDDKQAFQVVEKASFQNFVRSLNRYYKLPSSRTIVHAIHDLYNQAALDFKAIIENIPGRVAFTCDGWSSRIMRGYFVV
jgi:hypothetical protein